MFGPQTQGAIDSAAVAAITASCVTRV